MKYILLMVFSLISHVLLSKVIYVNQSVILGELTGDNWNDAFTDLSDALEMADEGDSIWIAKGEYFPSNQGNRYEYFELRTGISMIGGFLGNEIGIDERDILQNETVLNGNIGNLDMSEDNSFTVLYISYPDENTNIDGITVSNGRADSSNNSDLYNAPPRNGGGVFIQSLGERTSCNFQKCKFSTNYCSRRGGGFFINSQSGGIADLKFEDCVFFENEADDGVVIVVSGGMEKCTINNCDFKGNIQNNLDSQPKNLLDFSLVNDISDIKILNCLFEQNSGGEIRIREISNEDDLNHELLVSNCEFLDNDGFSISIGGFGNAEEDGKGGILIEDCTYRNNVNSAIMKCLDVNFAIVKDCTVENHSGSLFVFGGKIPSAEITNCIFSDITSPDNILINVFNETLSITNSIFFENSFRNLISLFSTDEQQEIIIENSVFAENIFRDFSNENFVPSLITGGDLKKINHCNFINNRTSTGRGYDFDGLFSVKNSIFYSDYLNYAHLLVSEEFPSEIENTLFFSKTCESIWSEGLANACGEDNLFDVNPEFENLTTGNYTLSSCSPAIDKGQSTDLEIDLAGRLRLEGTAPDLGAYETSTLKIIPKNVRETSCIKEDGAVDFSIENACEPYSVFYKKDGNRITSTNDLGRGKYVFFVEDGAGEKDSVLVEIKTSMANGDYLLFPSIVISGQTVQLRSCTDTFFKSEIFDSGGRLLSSEENQSETFSFSAPQQSGVYSIRLTDEFAVRKILRFIVQ